jgi:hypothetical protein
MELPSRVAIGSNFGQAASKHGTTISGQLIGAIDFAGGHQVRVLNGDIEILLRELGRGSESSP